MDYSAGLANEGSGNSILEHHFCGGMRVMLLCIMFFEAFFFFCIISLDPLNCEMRYEGKQFCYNTTEEETEPGSFWEWSTRKLSGFVARTPGSLG